MEDRHLQERNEKVGLEKGSAKIHRHAEILDYRENAHLEYYFHTLRSRSRLNEVYDTKSRKDSLDTL